MAVAVTAGQASATGDVGGTSGANLVLSVPGTVVSGTCTATALGLSSRAQATATYKVITLTPTLAVSPNLEPVETWLTATGTGFAPDEVVYVSYNTNGPAGWVTVAQAVALVPARSSVAAFTTAPFAFTTTNGSTVDVEAVGGESGAVAHFSYHVTGASVALNPAQGNPGASVTVTGTGFGPNEAVEVDWLGPPLLVLGDASADGGGTAVYQMAVPVAATVAEAYTVRMTGLTSGATATAAFVVPPPSATLDPTAGNAGATTQLSAAGFGDGEGVSITLRSPAGAVLTTATGTADGGGNVSTALTVPEQGTTPGAYLVTVLGLATGLSAVTTFAVAMPELSPTLPWAAPGASIGFDGALWGAGETVTLTWDSALVMSATPADASGSFVTSFQVPNDAQLGEHTVTAVGDQTGDVVTVQVLAWVRRPPRPPAPPWTRPRTRQPTQPRPAPCPRARP